MLRPRPIPQEALVRHRRLLSRPGDSDLTFRLGSLELAPPSIGVPTVSPPPPPCPRRRRPPLCILLPARDALAARATPRSRIYVCARCSPSPYPLIPSLTFRVIIFSHLSLRGLQPRPPGPRKAVGEPANGPHALSRGAIPKNSARIPLDKGNSAPEKLTSTP